MSTLPAVCIFVELSIFLEKKNSKVKVEDTEFSLIRKSVAKSQSLYEKGLISSEGKTASSS